MKIKNECTVELKYVIEDIDGTVLETSDETSPLEYVHGQGDLPPAMEEALEGHAEGDQIQVEFQVGECFEDVDPEKIVSVPRAEFPQDPEPKVGEPVMITVQEVEGSEEDQSLEARIIEVNPEAIILDANHPLSGIPVRFKVQVVSVKD